MKIKKILIANRSEIASRIIFSCNTLNIKTIAIYCKQDIFLPYVFQATENHPLSKHNFSAYLEQEEIIDIAKKLNADAIHPGYGFLSENYEFAQKVTASKLIWIGPDHKIIKSMADKINSKKIMIKSNIPVIPGIFIDHNDKEENIHKKVQILGYPLILKDPLGGGGKSIKKVFSSKELISALNIIKSETSRSTKSKNILIEKYIEKGRHIEIQIAGDGKKFIHLYERECSIQRRHQKIIEETPCNFIPKKTLNKLYNTTIKATKSIKYNNVGTVEFIITPNQKFYFLEMNTRLQVEHSITEQTTGIDLVELQIKLAESKKLNLKQKDIKQNNHSIECRIYAENPQKNFIPMAGKIKEIIIPNTPFSRIDTNLQKNMQISSCFDPMLAKITVTGKNRKKAIKNMLTTLNEFIIKGIITNINFLKKILKSKAFMSGSIHINTIEQKQLIKKKKCKNSKLDIALIIAAILSQRQNKKNKKNFNSWKIQQWQ